MDTVTTVVPFLPGGAATVIKGSRAANKALDATSLVRRRGSVKILGKAFQKEIDFAKELGEQGFDVVLRGSREKGGDLLVNGTLFELKTLQAGTRRAVEKRVVQGLVQGKGRVFVDGRAAGLTASTAQKSLAALKRRGLLEDAKVVIIKTKDGDVVFSP